MPRMIGFFPFAEPQSDGGSSMTGNGIGDISRISWYIGASLGIVLESFLPALLPRERGSSGISARVCPCMPDRSYNLSFRLVCIRSPSNHSISLLRPRVFIRKSSRKRARHLDRSQLSPTSCQHVFNSAAKYKCTASRRCITRSMRPQYPSLRPRVK
jgi:hypothetical protein